MKLLLVAAALSAVSYAQIDMAAITDCTSLDNKCRVGPDANMATCSAAKAQCEQCQTDYSQCRAPGNGVSGNQAGCAAQVVACVGSAYPGLSASVSSSAPAASATATDSDDCQSAYKVCVAGGKSEELCGCDLATCTGEDNARTRAYCASLSAGPTTGATATGAATALATSGVARPTASVGGVGSNSTSSTPIVTGAAASVGFSIFGAASAFVSYLLI
ncbi:hypothetical protein diail_4302 [Diaporthe ilicicola]|nr:hypothetical protein diail_4302 [Diaporthe ilicicola]